MNALGTPVLSGSAVASVSEPAGVAGVAPAVDFGPLWPKVLSGISPSIFGHNTRGPRRSAPRARARRRGRCARRSAYRIAPPRNREADRTQNVTAGAGPPRPAPPTRAP